MMNPNPLSLNSREILPSIDRLRRPLLTVHPSPARARPQNVGVLNRLHPSESTWRSCRGGGDDSSTSRTARQSRISQETLAEMVGTTRSRVNVFRNKFKKLGFIEYDGELPLKTNSSRLSVVLHE